jgi:hypothetical protein
MALTHATALHKLPVQYYLPKGGAQIQRAAFGAENAPALIIKEPPAINATEAL